VTGLQHAVQLARRALRAPAGRQRPRKCRHPARAAEAADPAWYAENAARVAKAEEAAALEQARVRRAVSHVKSRDQRACCREVRECAMCLLCLCLPVTV